MSDDRIISVKIGDKVSWFADKTFLGTIKGFVLHKKEFLAYVVWDKETHDDWYSGNCLIPVGEEK